ncbi:class I SAM-dependent methyltransferase [Thermogutta terrifontis]|uniref:class I SAM-dependent methyltransferase n=1 Tax=Thermogutta terrifontis TaxID=1331910 RepID=UPI000BA8A9A0
MNALTIERISRHLHRAVCTLLQKGVRVSVSLTTLTVVTTVLGEPVVNRFCDRTRASLPGKNVSIDTEIARLLEMETVYSLPRETLALLSRLCRQYTPKTICEFGSGLSTVVFANYARSAQAPFRVVAFEHSDQYAHQTRSILASFGLQDFAHILKYPTDIPEFLESVHDSLIDMVLVDGPPRTFGQGRVETPPSLRPALQHNGVFVLDDGFRRHERECVYVWRNRRLIRSARLYFVPHGVIIGRFTGR